MNFKMKTVAIVPMKLNNERLPNKNTKIFDNGKPLCFYILNTLLKVKNIDEIYVYCSDEKIKPYLPNKVKFIKRSDTLDKSSTTMNEVLNAFINDVDADIYVLTHVTAPFVKSTSLEKCIEVVKNNNEYDSAFSVKRINEFIWKDNKPFNYQLDNIPRTQDLPEIYAETCGFYIFKKELMKKYNRRIGDKPYMYEVEMIETIDIDDEFDFEIANSLLQKYGENLYE